MTTNPNEIEASLERWPGYTEQSWSERFAELDKRFGQLNASISTALLNRPAASARGVADGIESELARLPKGLSWSLGQMMGLPEHLRYRCFLSDHNTEDGKATRHLDCDKASPVEAIRAAIAEAESAWGYVSATSSPAATHEVEREAIARVIASNVTLEWHGHDHASLHPRSIAEAADAILALFRTPPAPAGEDHIPDARDMVEADAEVERILAMSDEEVMQGVTSEEIAKMRCDTGRLLRTFDAGRRSGFIAGRDAAARVAEGKVSELADAENAGNDETEEAWHSGAVCAANQIAAAIRAIEPEEKGEKGEKGE